MRPVSSRALVGSEKKIWQETAKTFSSVKAGEQGREKIGLHAHVAVEQHDDIVLRGAEPGVRSASEARDFRRARAGGPSGNVSRTNAALPSSEPLSTTMIRCRDGLRCAAITEGEIFVEQIAAVPVGNDDRSRGGCRFCFGRQGKAPCAGMQNASASSKPSAAIASRHRGSEGQRQGLSECARPPPRSASCRYHPSRARGPTPTVRPSLTQRDWRIMAS